MNILVVSQYFWPENFRINDLVVDLSERGHQVTVLTGLPNYPSGRIDDAFRNDPEAFANLGEVRIVRVPLLSRGTNTLKLILNYLSFMLSASVVGPWKLRSNRFDIVLTIQLSPVTVGIPAAIVARLYKVPMVMWIFDLWPESLEAVGAIRSTVFIRLMRFAVARIYHCCALILTQSRSFISPVQEMCRPETPVEYLPSWAEDLFQIEDGSKRVDMRANDLPFTVLFAGNIGDAQDFPCILAAAEILREYENIQWLVCGDGRMRQWVAKEVERRNLTRHVKLLGQLPLQSMPALYRKADALLVTLKDVPLFRMTVPGKLQSYFAAGKPILAALGGEGADLIRSSGSGMVSSPGDANGLAKAALEISRLTTSERVKMGAKGRQLYELEFQRGVVMNQLERRLVAVGRSSAKRLSTV